eukprot:1285919-Pyramimonas_sp.AAC.1
MRCRYWDWSTQESVFGSRFLDKGIGSRYRISRTRASWNPRIPLPNFDSSRGRSSRFSTGALQTFATPLRQTFVCMSVCVCEPCGCGGGVSWFVVVCGGVWWWCVVVCGGGVWWCMVCGVWCVLCVVWWWWWCVVVVVVCGVWCVVCGVRCAVC